MLEEGVNGIKYKDAPLHLCWAENSNPSQLTLIEKETGWPRHILPTQEGAKAHQSTAMHRRTLERATRGARIFIIFLHDVDAHLLELRENRCWLRQQVF